MAGIVQPRKLERDHSPSEGAEVGSHTNPHGGDRHGGWYQWKYVQPVEEKGGWDQPELRDVLSYFSFGI